MGRARARALGRQALTFYRWWPELARCSADLLSRRRPLCRGDGAWGRGRRRGRRRSWRGCRGRPGEEAGQAERRHLVGVERAVPNKQHRPLTIDDSLERQIARVSPDPTRWIDDEIFDAAVMNFGMLHLARPEQALEEAHRVLRTGGRFAFTVWAKPEEAVGFQIVLRAVEAQGEVNVTLPAGPPFFRFSDPEECIRSLRAAGFEAPKVLKLPQLWRLQAGDGLFEAMRDSTVRTAGLLRAQEPAALEKIKNYMREETDRYRKGCVVELPMPAILASAMRS
jgi:SAM-dependent methyltransferase